MWKRFWRAWTVDRPAAFGDCLWDVFVVQFAAWLDRLTLRKIIAFVPVVVLVLAYGHNIPLPPELMLVGDILAYLDVVSVLLLFSILSRVSTIVFVMKQAALRARELTTMMGHALSRLRSPHHRETHAIRNCRADDADNDDDSPPLWSGVAWA
jgi:hypothetical protein